MSNLKNSMASTLFDTLLGERSDGVCGLIYDTRIFFKIAKLMEPFTGKTTNDDKLLQRWTQVAAQVDEVCRYITLLRTRGSVRDLAEVTKRVEVLKKEWNKLGVSRRSPIRSVELTFGDKTLVRNRCLVGIWDEVLSVAEDVTSKIFSAMTEEISREDDAPTDEQVKAVFSALYGAKVIQSELPKGYVQKRAIQLEQRNYALHMWKAAFQGKTASGLKWNGPKKSLWWTLHTMGLTKDKDKRCVFDAFGLKYSQSLKGKVDEDLGDTIKQMLELVKNAMK